MREEPRRSVSAFAVLAPWCCAVGAATFAWGSGCSRDAIVLSGVVAFFGIAIVVTIEETPRRP